MSLALLFHYLLLNMFRMLIHLSLWACDFFDELLHRLYGSGSMCVWCCFVVVWYPYAGFMMDGETVRNMYSPYPKINLRNECISLVVL